MWYEYELLLRFKRFTYLMKIPVELGGSVSLSIR